MPLLPQQHQSCATFNFTTTPPQKRTPIAEEPLNFPKPHLSQSVHSLGLMRGIVSLNGIFFGDRFLLVKRVKKLEKQVKTGKARKNETKIVLSEEKADTEKISDGYWRYVLLLKGISSPRKQVQEERHGYEEAINTKKHKDEEESKMNCKETS
ncbi:hypothetical protein Tco_0891758 [Tanacetum coccineum]|uniref:Uncharacterized protein n=1 Tax=Tanacetum coccineum TaxID=301880 RepID=A0ABQ5C473_9ASTR